MSITRRRVLTVDQEQDLKEKMEPLWAMGTPGPEIAKILGFGELGEYEKLKPEYIYNYRQRFNLPKRYDRKHYPHRYKYGKQQEPISASEFFKRIDKLSSSSYHHKRKRSFNIVCFYSGLRQGEWRLVRRDDIKIDGDNIIVNAFRLKKGNIPAEDATHPIILKKYWKLIPEFLDWIGRFGTGERIFNISATTAWKYVKDIFPKGYPHYYRLVRITDMCNNTNMTVAEIRNWTFLHLSTIQSYISKSRRIVEAAADKMDFPREE